MRLMKKLLFLLAFLPSALWAQKTSVCGVDFGSTYEQAESILEKQFGQKYYKYSNDLKMCFRDKSYGGVNWSSISFLFQNNGERTFMNRCTFVSTCKTLAEAEKMRDSIKQKFGAKDDFPKQFNHQYLAYIGGVSPVDGKRFGYTIDIIKYQDETFGVRLDYGPYDYIK